MKTGTFAFRLSTFDFGIALACVLGLSAAHAQSYPSKPIRLVVATTAGAQPDMLARMFGQKLTETWGQPVVVDNRPGANGALGAIPVSKAAPDGYTLLYAQPNFTIGPTLQSPPAYDPVKDFTGITQIGFTTNALVATPTLGAKTLPDFIALAKSQPGKLIFATSPAGSAAHLSAARFNMVAGIKGVHVAFKGGPEAAIEVLAGRVHYHIGTLGVLLPFIKDGRLVGLAITSPQRTPVLPDVPTMGETFAEFKRPETSHGMVAPAGTPRAVIAALNKEMTRILALPDVRQRTQDIGFTLDPSSVEEYNKILRGQMETLAKLVRDAGLKPK
jgi:tripartite-type tricarboxylate transporter receptor subunit TctC